MSHDIEGGVGGSSACANGKFRMHEISGIHGLSSFDGDFGRVLATGRYLTAFSSSTFLPALTCIQFTDVKSKHIENSILQRVDVLEVFQEYQNLGRLTVSTFCW